MSWLAPNRGCKSNLNSTPSQQFTDIMTIVDKYVWVYTLKINCWNNCVMELHSMLLGTSSTFHSMTFQSVSSVVAIILEVRHFVQETI